MEILLELVILIFKTLVDLWLFDLEVFSNKWMYIPLCIPAFGYLIFFVVKWAVLLYPLWGTLALIFKRAEFKK
jgi:hypothetical protein